MGNATPHQQAQPVTVEPPRACDAVGNALRDAYGKELTLPDDMIICLRKLNGNGGSQSRN